MSNALRCEELGTWALDSSTINYLEDRIRLERPDSILEFGSGISTICLARFMWELHHDERVRVWSFDQHTEFAEKSREHLAQLGLARTAQVIYAPLRQYTMDDIITECYDLDNNMLKSISMEASHVLVLVDGPAGDRYATLPLVRDSVPRDTVFYLDDAFRDTELDIAGRWTRYAYARECRLVPIGKGVLCGVIGRSECAY